MMYDFDVGAICSKNILPFLKLSIDGQVLEFKLDTTVLQQSS